MQTTAFKNSLLKIGGVDARSLVEIKQRRIGYTLSIFSRGMDAAGYIRSDVSAVSETHSQNYTRMYSFDDATTQMPRLSSAFANRRYRYKARAKINRRHVGQRTSVYAVQRQVFLTKNLL